MTFLITGGAGFIGSHLVQQLEALGEKVVVLDSLTTGSKGNLEAIKFRGELVLGDIRDREVVSKLVSNAKIVIHLAASLGVSNIMNKTLESISTNIFGSEVVLTECANQSKRILIASTSEIYGKNPSQPLKESDDRIIGSPQNIRWSYSDAKAVEEAMARSLFLDRELQVTTLRFFNTVGPRQTGKYGMVIPRLSRSALADADLIIHGTGEQTRVFCHVRDAVEGIISILNAEGSVGEVFNIGGFGEISINDLADKIINISDSRSKKVHVPYENVYPVGFEDMMRRVPDTSKIKSLTGWTPNHSIESIISDVLRSMN